MGNGRLRLTVVGSADAFNGGGRGHSCYLLEGAGCGPLLVDCGATALAGLRRLGREPREIVGIALTHLHADHFGGVPFVLIDGIFNAVRSEPLHVVGPVGCQQRIEAAYLAGFVDVVKYDRPYELFVRELRPAEQAELGGATVRAFAADHMDPPEQPLCLQVESPTGQRVTFTGDTAMCDGLLAAARGVDLLVADCSGLQQPCGRHCSWQEWLEALPTMQVRQVLLTHLSAEVRQQVPELLEQVPDGVDVMFADDGLQLDI